MSMKDLAEELAAQRARALQMGGAAAVARQHEAGKLTARERIDRLFDAGTFSEIGVHATHAGIAADLAGKHTAADGVITGFGKVDGRPASVVAYDLDDVIDPRETRPVLVKALEMARTKRVDRPWRKHGVMPSE